ncbi:MAG: ROK family protein [Bacteroidota bacterium]
MSFLWGIDLGGTKIEGVILDPHQDNLVIERTRVPTEKEGGYDHIVQQVARLVDILSERSGVQPEKLGMGTPGTTDPITGLLKNSNTTVLNGRSFQADVSKALGIPVTMANDANCFAIAEARMGVVAEQMPEAAVVFGIIMGTGVGGGLVVNGHVLNGRQGIAGEWGHNFLDESGGPCYCGREGCVEKIIAGPSLERFYQRESGEQKGLKEIVQLAGQGRDPVAVATLDRLHHFFGKGVATIVNMIDPDAIVIGGGVGNIPTIYTEGVKEVEKYTFNHQLDTRFFKPSLGDSAGVFGAAFLVAD